MAFPGEHLPGMEKAPGSTPSTGNKKVFILCLWACQYSAFLSHLNKSLSLEPVKEVKLTIIPELVV